MIRENPLNRMAKFMLTLNGVWPGASTALFWRMVFIVSIPFAQYCHYRYLKAHMHSITIGDFIDCLSSFIAHCKVLFKCLVFWLNQRKFIEVLEVMREDWSDCANNDICMRETVRKAKVSERVTKVMMILHTTTIVTYSIGTILADIDVTNNTTELLFYTKVEFPFDVNTQRTYRFILAIDFFFLLMCSWCAGIMNTLLLILTIHVAGQINIVRHWLMQLASPENKSKNVSIATTKIIQKHQKIIRFTENIESLYTYIALMLFVSNMIMICLLAFVVVTAIGSPNATEVIMRSLLFYIITNFEAYIFCYAGEYLKNKSKEIGFAAYSCSWYNMKCEKTRTLSFVILRSQKQLTFTIGKMMDLSMQSFTSIMNTSGSYLSVLLAMQ
ncbi:odorant receptor 4 [Solenopsis invicta]|uniref:odorant receptor 4 n=1 Tax=Solenopsis invicta TaxID=13686 RepID=UPI000E33DD23|nr:odorant receptor 4 [Solenopsis invicta]